MPDRIVFVTGAATGIGRATVERLHREGWSLALFDIDGEAIAALAAALGPRVLAFPGSVGDLAALEAAMAETVRRFGRIDAVFANAGIARAAPVMLMEEADWLRVVDVNLNGVFRTLKAAAPHLMASRGYVLVTSSITSTVALPFGAAYVATKAAVLNLAEAFRTEMCGHGVEVGTIHPTFIRTPLVEGAIHGTEIGRLARSTSSILFIEFPLAWVSWTAARMLTKRLRRDTVPSWTHRPILWFPRAANRLINLWAWGPKTMRRIMDRAIEIDRRDRTG